MTTTTQQQIWSITKKEFTADIRESFSDSLGNFVYIRFYVQKV